MIALHNMFCINDLICINNVVRSMTAVWLGCNSFSEDLSFIFIDERGIHFHHP